MKIFITSVLFFFSIAPFLTNAQAGMWTWVKGDSVPNSHGSYGAMGVALPTNDPPARYACAQWLDTTGNFWVYGGWTDSGGLADLWKFDPVSTDWTWINGTPIIDTTVSIQAAQGVFHPDNLPGSLGLGVLTWVDKHNHFWMYGGHNFSALKTSADLWQYDPLINQWAWMGGGQGDSVAPVYGTLGLGNVSTTPGSRDETNATWIDTLDNLWFFGGQGTKSTDFRNDVWKYNISTGIWTWMSGNNVANPPGIYTNLGVPSVSYAPSGRSCTSVWSGTNGNIFMNGGLSLYGSFRTRNDVWKFNTYSLEWTWLRGSMLGDTTRISQGDCKLDNQNEEGARFENRATWKLCDNIVLSYGGEHGNNGPFTRLRSDLWAYIIPQNAWLKIAEYGMVGSYGSRNVPAILNYPPVRRGGLGFVDKTGKIWLFGGGSVSAMPRLFYNDTWCYQIDTGCLAVSECSLNCHLLVSITTNKNTFCASDSARVCAPSGFTTYLWNTGQSGSCITAKLAGNYYVTVTDANGCTAESNRVAISVYPLPPVSITTNGDTLTVYEAVTQQWYLNGSAISGATSNVYIANGGGSYTVQVTDSNGCVATSNPIVISGIENISEADVISIYPNPSQNNWQLTVGNNLIGGMAEVFDADGRVVFQSAIVNPQSEINFNAARGIYLLRISSAKSSVVRKLVKL